MRRSRLVFAMMVAAVACKEATGPEIPAFIGAWCEGVQEPIVEQVTGGWVVRVRVSTTTYQDVRRTDGTLVRQEVRGCALRTCAYPSSGFTRDQAVSACRSGSGGGVITTN